MNEFENVNGMGNGNNSDMGNDVQNNHTDYGENSNSGFRDMNTRDYINSVVGQASQNNNSYGQNIQNNGFNNNSFQDNAGYTGVQSNSLHDGFNANNGMNNEYRTSYDYGADNSHYSEMNTAELNNGSYEPSTKKAKSKKEKHNKSGKAGSFIKKSVAIVAAAAVFGVVSGGIFNYFTGGSLFHRINQDGTKTSEEATTEEKIDVVIPATSISSDGKTDSQSLDVSDIAEGVMPSVVSITIEGVEHYQTFFGQVYEQPVEGAGSGIIIGKNDTELLVATNNHVVSDATTVSVQFIDEEVYEAKVKGTDSDNDLAIIVVKLADISKDTLSKIKIAQLGDSDSIKVGQQVVAIGNALGYGQSVTTGIVSAKDRTVDTNTTPLIQTDAAINPGNSGGALLNMNGEVIGINSSKYASTDVEGMGYAIPISKVHDILDDLMSRETRDKVDEDKMGYLGISCSTISQEASQMYGMPTGVLIQEVSEGSAADKAGLKKNYIITKFDGQTVSSSEDLIGKLAYYEAGESVEITYKVLRDDDYIEKTTTVVLGKKDSAN